MDALFDWVIGLRWNGLLALCLYWVPLSLCAYGYSVRTWTKYRAEVAQRAKAEASKDTDPGKFYYHPTETVGTLIGRALATVVPVVNLFAGIFDIGPEVFGDFFRWIGRVFDQPLVPKRGK